MRSRGIGQSELFVACLLLSPCDGISTWGEKKIKREWKIPLSSHNASPFAVAVGLCNSNRENNDYDNRSHHHGQEDWFGFVSLLKGKKKKTSNTSLNLLFILCSSENCSLRILLCGGCWFFWEMEGRRHHLQEASVWIIFLPSSQTQDSCHTACHLSGDPPPPSFLPTRIASHPPFRPPAPGFLLSTHKGLGKKDKK